MKCDGCKKNEAHLVLHMITNGQVATRSLCMECAKKAHEEMTQAFSTMGMTMAGLDDLRPENIETQRESLRLPRMICASCRTAYEDIGHDTVFGCPQCYQAFHGQVIDYLSTLKELEEPARAAAVPLRIDLAPVTESDLRERLNDALKTEDYEQAASLRDRLRECINAKEGGTGESDE